MFRIARDLGIELRGGTGWGGGENFDEDEEQPASADLVANPVLKLQDMQEPVCLAGGGANDPGIVVNWLGGSNVGQWPFVLTEETGFGWLEGYAAGMREFHDALRWHGFDSRNSKGLEYWTDGKQVGLLDERAAAGKNAGKSADVDFVSNLRVGLVGKGPSRVGNWLNGLWIRRKARELSNLNETLAYFWEQKSDRTSPASRNTSTSSRRIGIGRLADVGLNVALLESLPYPNALKKTMASVDFLMGATGAGFTNQIFLRPGSRVIVVDCSHCLQTNPGLSLQYPGKCHDLFSPYLGVHALHYLVDTPQGPGPPSLSEDEIKLKIPDVKHYWRVVHAFLEQTTEERMGKYLSDAAGWGRTSTTLLCDANTKDRFLICRLAGTDIFSNRTRIFNVTEDGEAVLMSNMIKEELLAKDTYIDAYFQKKRSYLEGLGRRGVPGAQHWAETIQLPRGLPEG